MVTGRNTWWQVGTLCSFNERSEPIIVDDGVMPSTPVEDPCLWMG